MAPARTPGTKPSQMPEASERAVSGWVAGFQPLKSPTTDTEAAFGAQTEKCVPCSRSARRGVRPQLLVGADVRAFAKEIDVLIGEQHLASPAITIPEWRNP